MSNPNHRLRTQAEEAVWQRKKARVYTPPSHKTSITRRPDGSSMWPPNSDRPFNLAEKLMAFEASELEDTEIFELFQYLIDTGHAWTLQGSYGRTAMMLIEGGQCHVKEEA
jgi:hypothetical protein